MLMKIVGYVALMNLCTGAWALSAPSRFSPSSRKAPQAQTLLAQNSEGKAGKGRKKILTGEARTKGASTKTNIDFEAAAIDGERRIPAGVAIGGAKQDHEYDLINLRLRWHPEMIKSTSNLETGKGP